MILHFSAKTSDLNHITILDGDKVVYVHNGYVPKGIGIGAGDYVEFSIDTNTGKIEDWKPIKIQALIELKEKKQNG